MTESNTSSSPRTPTINYIIASYNCSQTKRKYKFPEDTLKIHIRQLKELRCDLTQITLMKADSEGKEVYPDYYFTPEEEAEMGLQVFEAPNQGFSNGQWLRGYERRTQEYDYYIFCEDDYCPGIHSFDKILINLYRKKFPDNVGFMSSLIQGQPKHKMELPFHYEGMIVLSRETLEKLYRWDENPKRYLEVISPPFARILPGGREQVNFTTTFRLAEIPITDTIPEFSFVYWNDCPRDSCGGEVFFFEKPEDFSHVVNKYLYENLNTVSRPNKLYMCVPTQFARTCVLVAGMHRSGTSVFSGSLSMAGLDYGKNKAKVKDSFNEHGYFENMTILHFNEAILAHIRSHWHDAAPLTESQVQAMLEKKDELMKIVREEFSTNFFFIKDPRISLLLPLYLSALKSMCIRVVIVFSDRNNGSIAHSLHRAQGIPPLKGVELCNKYKNCLLKFKRDYTIYRFLFMDFLENPVSHVENVLDYGNRGEFLTNEQKEKISAFVNPSHVHY